MTAALFGSIPSPHNMRPAEINLLRLKNQKIVMKKCFEFKIFHLYFLYSHTIVQINAMTTSTIDTPKLKYCSSSSIIPIDFSSMEKVWTKFVWAVERHISTVLSMGNHVVIFQCQHSSLDYF